MFQITIFFLYIIAGALFAATRLSRFSAQGNMLVLIAFTFGVTGILWHAFSLWFAVAIPGGIVLSLGNTASLIGLQLALTAFIAGFEKTLRGLSGGLLLLAGAAALLTGDAPDVAPDASMSWQIQSHIVISLFAYGLITVGALVAVYALIQEQRLQAGKLSPINQLFAPLETTEKLLFGLATSGFLILLIAVLSSAAFVDDLFAQHLVHKTALSILALLLFGALIAARWIAGWRGKKAIYLYLGGFAVLCLAYFGSRFILEEILGRSWS